MSNSNSQWVPEIMYEESGEGLGSNIPFIMVPEDETMPELLYVFESRETGETEPGLSGDEVPVVQWDLHQYADMALLKERLTVIEYDNVRYALGLESLGAAADAGREVTNKIRENLENKE
tara:strand:+ start:218 stop:577 length:360 start_codon:yes stop_codon:yes gene_type:complete